MSFKPSKRTLDNLKGVHPDLVSVTKLAMKKTKVDFTVVCGLRTIEQQKTLYAQGRTEPGKIVTWTMNSRHLGGYAIDFVAQDKEGRLTWDEKHYPPVVAAFKDAAHELKIPIVCGIDWEKPDYGHVELDKEKYK